MQAKANAVLIKERVEADLRVQNSSMSNTPSVLVHNEGDNDGDTVLFAVFATTEDAQSASLIHCAVTLIIPRRLFSGVI